MDEDKDVPVRIFLIDEKDGILKISIFFLVKQMKLQIFILIGYLETLLTKLAIIPILPKG